MIAIASVNLTKSELTDFHFEVKIHDAFDFDDIKRPKLNEILIKEKFIFEVEIYFQLSGDVKIHHIQFPLLYEDLKGFSDPETALSVVDRLALTRFLNDALGKVSNEAIDDEAQKERTSFNEKTQGDHFIQQYGTPTDEYFFNLGLINIVVALIVQFLRPNSVNWILDLERV